MTLLNWLLRRKAIDPDLDAEIRNHFETAIAERIAAGEDPESARLAAVALAAGRVAGRGVAGVARRCRPGAAKLRRGSARDWRL
ncbi:MAG: permease prefix domain 1-containing protein [Cyanobacteria bacterium]|nr:permease prefix domain 1-containing protein [Cyanobacteriota bacterium]